MAYADARFGYQQSQTDAALDNKQPAFIDTDGSALLNHSVLEADMMQSPNDTFRKNSFANSNGVLSPADSQTWDHPFSTGLNPDPAASAFQDDGGVFLRQSNTHVAPYPGQQQQQQHSSWTFENGSGNSTPTTGGNFMPPPQYDGAQFIPRRSDAGHENFGQQQHSLPQHFISAPQVQTPMSPHSHQDWMGMAEREMESRPSHKRMRPNSPPRSTSELQRRDGIRKKNGRIDIPQERNIQNIEDLIEQATDDEMLKELKQQKRLLRNREAALASRQRKKKHTEELEVKEKSYTQKIASLESQVNDFNREREHRSREHQTMHQRLQEALRMVETMREERQELVRAHTEETSTLRRQRDILREQLEAGSAPGMTAQSSSTYADLYPGMEALHMSVGRQDWQQEDWAVGDFFPPPTDVFHNQPDPVKSSDMHNTRPAAVVAGQGSQKNAAESRNDPPIAQGLLFMLLLCGAFVASKPANSRPSALPNMPANVRAAAPTILNDLLAGFDSTSGSRPSRVVVNAEQPLPSASTYKGARSGRMERVHHSITAPTKQQEMDQAFSLTPAQYASMTNTEFSGFQQPSALAHSEAVNMQRRPLAEALANLEEQPTSSIKAEVYTRSLLWEQIPADVVRQFKDIVRDHNTIEARKQDQQDRRHSNDFTFKNEK